MFSIRIFLNSVIEQKCFFRCCAIELVSERCIVNRLDRTFKLIYNVCFFQNPSRGGGIIVNNRVRGFKFILV